MVTLKPTTPLLTPNKGLLKPASPLHPKNAPKTPISHPQRRWWFQTGPPGRQGQTAAPMGGGRAWPGFETTRRAEGSQRGRRAGGPPPTGTPSSPAPLVWRAPEGPEDTAGPASTLGLAAVPVGVTPIRVENVYSFGWKMSTEIGGKCIIVYIFADHRRFRCRLYLRRTTALEQSTGVSTNYCDPSVPLKSPDLNGVERPGPHLHMPIAPTL